MIPGSIRAIAHNLDNAFLRRGIFIDIENIVAALDEASVPPPIVPTPDPSGWTEKMTRAIEDTAWEGA